LVAADKGLGYFILNSMRGLFTSGSFIAIKRRIMTLIHDEAVRAMG
jgi:hypothetical protein